ncbi:MAG: M4 family metallopeptidase [Saprospiraceae bacterium]|nr:M4 family metallopeptidase [Saprospiraceae bacterium]
MKIWLKNVAQNLERSAKKYIGGEQFRSDLVIFHVEDRLEGERLAWHVVAYPNMMHRWEYFVDAESGVILDSYRASCDFLGHIHDQLCASHNHAHAPERPENETRFNQNALPTVANVLTTMDGKTIANALDLVDSTRRLNTYQIGQNYYLIDANRAMFNATQSSLPQKPVGAIVTLDSRNSDGGDQAFFITTTTNAWADKKAVSAHYNAGRAYEYFSSVFKRNSIDGNGGNVLSFINVTDEGAQMDNAFWNGEAMFYGNGDQVFKPLAGALDVAGHEIGHGVIQNTANLRYQGESGALNESFADIFGAMIDRADWKMGEDIIKDTRTFPSGALRDLQNPNNGVAKGQPAWQPAKYSERFTGTGDNGGVHINSGIPNRAYYLFATNAAVGKDRAEQIFYRALDVYLITTSKFIDLRASVEKSCADLFPGNANILAAAQTAFATVEIGAGGNAGGGTTQPTLPTNTGKDWLLHVSDDQTELLLTDYASTLTAQLRQFSFFDKGVYSRPSITDDGTKAVFVGEDKFVYFIDINWTTNQFTQAQKLLTTGNWKNAAISKDGSRVVLNRFTADSTARQLVVYNIATRTQKVFTLFNPTTSDKQTKTNEVQFSDALEWDYSGEFVMYDAFNEIPIAGTNQTINYWDIGFISVWDNAAKTFGQGEIFKLFSGLPENTSVGNATFAKKSPNIIAFDFIEEDSDDNFIGFLLYGANIETGDLSASDEGIFRNDALGVPSFSNLDDKILFTTKGIADTNILALATIDLAADKINPKPNSRIPVLLEDAQKGSWFNNAKRVITSATELTPIAFQLAPNPFSDNILLTFEAEKMHKARSKSWICSAKLWHDTPSVF